MQEEIKTKVCSKCGRELPMNTDYYFKNNSYKDGFMGKCKECTGHEFTNKLTHIPKEGYNFCLKCGRELPQTGQYFPKDLTTKSGLRNVCRECIGREFLIDNYKERHIWTKEENELFLKVYPYFTNEELIKLYFPFATNKNLFNKAYVIGSENKTDEVMRRVNLEKSVNYSGENSYNYGKHMSDESKRKLSIAKTGKYVGENSPLYGIPKSEEHKRKMSVYHKKLGIWKGDKNPRHLNPLNGELNGRWDGGIKQLYYDLRDHLQEWKKTSMEYCDYKCVLTGLRFDNIHHVYNFKNIVKEIFDELNMERLQTIGEYTEKQREMIYKLLNEKHEFYGYGLCLSKPIHKLFHDTYGYFNNTKEQFNEFTNRYYNFEFDNLLENKYKYLNVRKEVS